ncbi:serpin B13 isoform X3 [Myotis daubentonii]|uniref:serpin B13 isoform X3 n=1 Tax=Myotis daubentonii TaxID=98922 RepID=UPI0028736909|nr:serpin B13 isoform X3 [Myotis daubentonii]
METLDAVTFGFNLFKELNRKNNGNIFFSPASILAAVGMLLLRTRGATATRLQKVPLSEKDTDSSRIKAEEKETEKTKEIHHQFQTFLSEISKPNNNYELKIANRLFGEKTYLFLQKYLDYVEKYYHASLEPVDFVNAADESRKKINSWVESQTHENIKDLFPDATLSSTTKLVLVNIVHFKGQWDREFKKEHTKEEEFWLDKIINEVSPEKLVEWTNPGQMEERTVDLHLPRFEVEDSYDLEAALGAMGLGDAFSELEADYSGASPRSGLHAQKFLHGSFVVVTEEGTQAAAGTGMGFAVTSAPSYETFHCNHPFLFFIRHNESNSVLFFGKFSSP